MENLRKLFQIQTSDYKEITMKDIEFIEKLMNGENLLMISKDLDFSLKIKKSEMHLENFFKELQLKKKGLQWIRLENRKKIQDIPLNQVQRATNLYLKKKLIMMILNCQYIKKEWKKAQRENETTVAR